MQFTAAQADPLPHADDAVPRAVRPAACAGGRAHRGAGPTGTPAILADAATPEGAATRVGTPAPRSVTSMSRLSAPYSRTT